MEYVEAKQLVEKYKELKFNYDGRLTSSFDNFTKKYTSIEEFEKEYIHFKESLPYAKELLEEINRSVTRRDGKPYELLIKVHSDYLTKIQKAYAENNLGTEISYKEYEEIFNLQDVKGMLSKVKEYYPGLNLDDYGVYETENGHVLRINFLDFDNFMVTVNYCVELMKMEINDKLDNRYAEYNKEMLAYNKKYLPLTEYKFRSYLQKL